MHHKVFVIILNLLFGCTSSLFAQKIPKPESSNRVVLHRADTLYIFYAFLYPPVRKEMSLNDSKEYFWYQPDNIQKTVGGHSGRILHGDYKVLYPGGNLKEKGSFNQGLKTGIWKKWFEDGKLESIQYWKDGEKEGALIVYSGEGKVIKEYHFHKNLLSGQQLDVINDTLTRKLFYKSGRLMQTTTPEKPAKDSTDRKE